MTPGTAVKMPPLIECCAPGRTEEQCTAMCGDGKVSGDEKCDTKIPAGMPGACPTTCAPTNSCTPQQVMGTECATTCVPMPITMAGAADGCCPMGANATTDRDCKPSCGNGVVETGETCDPKESCKACQTTNACAPQRATGSADTCNLRCEPVAITQCRNSDNCCPRAAGRTTTATARPTAATDASTQARPAKVGRDAVCASQLRRRQGLHGRHVDRQRGELQPCLLAR